MFAKQLHREHLENEYLIVVYTTTTGDVKMSFSVPLSGFFTLQTVRFVQKINEILEEVR